MKRGKDPVIVSIGNGGVIAKMQELTGISRVAGTEGLREVTLALAVWLEAMCGSIPRGTQAECTLAGLGTFRVSYRPKQIIYGHPRIKIPAWRKLSHMPPPPSLLTITFDPASKISQAIAVENRLIRADRAAAVAAARVKDRESFRRAHAAFIARRDARGGAMAPGKAS